MSAVETPQRSSSIVSERVRFFQKPPTGRRCSSVSRRNDSLTNGSVRRSQVGEKKSIKADCVPQANGDGAHNDDSGYQSRVVNKTFDRITPSQGDIRRASTASSIDSTSCLRSDDSTPPPPQPAVNGGAKEAVAVAPSSVQTPVATSTPLQAEKRRASISRTRRDGSLDKPTTCPVAPPSAHSTTGKRGRPSTNQDPVEVSSQPQSLVTQTVAVRRARAEALELERRRLGRARLEASRAALQAACDRAHSIRAARSAELRSRDEERRAKVTERRKALEKERKEHLARRVSSTEGAMTRSQLHPLRSAQSRASVCGFSSELDPSDPRYCPFGFGSSSRRDVCLSTRQQIDVLSKSVSNAPGGGAAFARLTTSFTTAFVVAKAKSLNATVRNLIVPNQERAGPGLAGARSTVSSTNRNPTPDKPSDGPRQPKRPVVKQQAQNPPSIPLSPVSVPRLGATPPTPPIPLQRTHSTVTTPKPVKTGGTITRRGSKITANAAVVAGEKTKEDEERAYRERLNEQRRLVREKRRLMEEAEARRLKREDEVNRQLEETARTLVNEALTFAVAELKAEAVEASNSVSNCSGGIIATRAADLLESLSNPASSLSCSSESSSSSASSSSTSSANVATMVVRRCRSQDSGEQTRDMVELLDGVVNGSKQVLSSGVEKMVLSANTDSIRRPHSEILKIVANTVSNSNEREERRARLDQIMSRIRNMIPTTTTTTTTTPSSVPNGDKQTHNKSEVVEEEPLVTFGRPPTMNCKRVLLQRSRSSSRRGGKEKPVTPPLELCSANSSVSDFEQNLGEANSPSPASSVISKHSVGSPGDSGNERGSGELGGLHSSRSSSLNCRGMSRTKKTELEKATALVGSRRSSCSDVSAISDLQH